MEPESPLRVYLAGKVIIERGDVLVRESRLPGRQGRLAFAMLAAERERPLTKEELAEELWSGDPPTAWEVALRAIVSKLRTVLGEVGLDGAEALPGAFGTYQLHLPAGAWVDLEAAAGAVHLAETARRAGDLDGAVGWSLVANAIARRGFLPGEEGAWVARVRSELRSIRIRALECRGEALLARGDHSGALADAELALGEEPFRETAHRLPMRAHVAAGNPAEALRVYERCRTVLVEELGVSPSAETEAVYVEILRSG